jgi:Flp pilus assembly protein TadD
MGTALVRQNRHREAIAWFEKALRERREDTDALQGLGVALAECKELERAVGCWKEAVRRGVATADIHENLAHALSALGRRQEAREHRALSRRLQGKPRFGLDLLREAWEWLSGGARPSR